MNNQEKEQPYLSRRNFLRLSMGAGGALVLGAVGALARADMLARQAEQASLVRPVDTLLSPLVDSNVIRLGATDGYITLPGRPNTQDLYIFGFVDVAVDATINEAVGEHKGNVQMPAPILAVNEDDDVYVTVTNLGLVVRPDLDDSHTMHWHGFRNPTSVFDGVPEVSIAVPVARNFTYYFKPRDPGTYMYHCHFEDVEHVQMGMNGIVFVRPAQNGGTGSLPAGKYVYNDNDGSTEYDREFALMLNEIDTRPHDLLEAVQEFIWSDYKANYWVINGRSYPHTLLPNSDPSLPNQPVSSLIQANGNERILLRMANLGYEQHAMQLTGIPMKVVGHDATLLRNPPEDPAGIDLTYFTNAIYIGPGEARDVIFIAPVFDDARQTETDPNLGRYNPYLFKNRNYQQLTNNGLPGLGGMATEVRVYEDPLPDQTEPNEVFA